MFHITTFKNDIQGKKKTTFNIVKNDNSMITPDEIKDFYFDIVKKSKRKFNDDFQISLVAQNKLQTFTLKKLGDDPEDINLMEADEYMNGRVQNSKQFGNFYKFQISIVTN